jgi:inosose dehydratase
VSKILVGSALDWWGVWFPDDPQQTPYTRFLDEVAESGYEWIELGPFGYLPTDPKQLSDELAVRSLKLSAGTVFERLHQDNSWDAVWSRIEDVAKLTAAVGGKHVVVIPEMRRDPATGAVLEDRNLTAEQWQKKTEGRNELGIVEQDMYPCKPDAPLPIAQRTRMCLGSCGVPSVKFSRFNGWEPKTYV